MTLRTVLGDIDFDRTRAILPHEHLVIDYRQKKGEATPISKATEDHCVEVLSNFADAGVQAIVDCTPPGYGRDIEFLRCVSARSGVHIVASTGTFCEQWSEQPAWAQDGTIDELAAGFGAELGRACGVIKVATSHTTATDNEVKAIKAAARTHRDWGSPIVSHTSGSLGLEQVELYDDQGVDLSKVLISHVCAEDEPVEYAIAIAKRGAYVGLDRIGHEAHSDNHWLSIIQRLLAEGLEDRILLSHDSVQRFTGPDAISAHTFSNIHHLTGVFRAKAMDAGISSETFNRLTVNNPLTWLTSKRVTQ